MKVVLADDEPLARDLLRALLAEVADVEVVGEAGDGLETMEQVAALDPDLLILAIELPGRDGMAAAELLRGRPDADAGRPAVIFATAHSDRALDAFGLDAADYLMKPIRRERLDEALERVRRRMAAAGQGVDEACPDLTLDAIWAPTRQGQVRVPLADVSHVVAAKDHVFLHLNGRPYMVRMTMARIEAVAAPFGLARVHRSVLVRPERIAAVSQSGKAVRLRLDDGTDLPVGPAYRSQVRAWIGRATVPT